MRSLATRNQAEAKQTAAFIRTEIYRITSMARKNPALSATDLKEMADRYFEWALVEAKREREGTRLAPRQIESKLNQLSEAIDILNQLLKTGRSTSDRRYVQQLMENEGIDLDTDSPEYEQLAECAVRAQAEIFKMKFDWVSSGRVSPMPDPSSFGIGRTAQNDSTNETFRVVTDKFLEEHRRKWKAKTYEKYRANLGHCTEIVGGQTPIRQVGKASVRRIKELLEQLPRNWRSRYSGVTIEEAVSRAMDEAVVPMAPTSVNAYLTALSSMFNWAVRFGYVDANPVSGIRAVDHVKAADKRHSFNPESLRLIFSAPLYTGARSARKWQVSGNHIERDGRYWLPLIALFSGMRLGEILNLKKEHLLVVDGVPVFDVVESKSWAGIRKIPMHSELVRCGLADHFANLQEGSTAYPELSEKAYSKFFRRFQNSLGINDPKLVFHSFRHTFTDALRAAQVDTSTARVLLGHADSSVTGQYGSGYPISVLNEAIAAIEYSSLDLSHIYREATP